MTPEDYAARRNELADLLQSACRVKALEELALRNLRRIRKKIREDQFVIVLAGEFQGGKSTTFNALCDGRPLSPTGSGIKTSGTLVSAMPLSDPEAPETARVLWRSDADLLTGFSDLTLPHLQHLDPARFRDATARELPERIRLDSPEDRELIRRAVAMEMDIWRNDPAGYDPKGRGHLDVLRCAGLIARFANSGTLERFRDQDRFAVEAVRDLAAFPRDWEERWLKSGPDGFALEEVLFLFIAELRLEIHSPSLSRIGCLLVDCPGLFASRWDTETARRAMFSADAILYLFDGTKTPKLSDLHALAFIRQNGMASKLIFACNMRGNTLTDARRIFTAGTASLAREGFAVTDDNAALVHSLLAFLALRLKTEGDESPPKSQIDREILRQLMILGADAGVSPENMAEIALEISNLPPLTAMMEGFVIRNRAWSVLVDNGARILDDCLKEAEGALQAREETAFEQEKTFRNTAATVETELLRFTGDCAGILARLEDEGADYVLAEDAWRRINACQESLMDRLTERIYSEVATRASFSLWRKSRFREKVGAIVKEEIDERFTAIISGWMADLRTGANPVYHRQITRRVQEISADLKHIWDRSALAEHRLLSGIVIPEFSGDLEMDFETLLGGTETGHVLENVRISAILASGGLTGVFTATSGILVAVYMLITRLFWLRIATVATLILNVVLVIIAKGWMEKSIKEEIRGKLTPAVAILFQDLKDPVRAEFRKFIREIRQFYINAFREAVKTPQRVFRRRKQQAETDFLKSRETRTAIARDARKIRETEILPLRRAIDDFIQRVPPHPGTPGYNAP